MKLYFSAEYSEGVDKKIEFILNNILYKIESLLEGKKYGDELTGLTAIPIIVSNEFSNIRERKFVSWKNKETDVRLKVNFEAFINGDFDKCCDLILKNCVDSYHIAYEKSMQRKKGDFYIVYNEFIDDFISAFMKNKNAISKESIDLFNSYMAVYKLNLSNE